jgi:hypothetical protein
MILPIGSSVLASTHLLFVSSLFTRDHDSSDRIATPAVRPSPAATKPASGSRLSGSKAIVIPVIKPKPDGLVPAPAPAPAAQQPDALSELLSRRQAVQIS